MTAVTCNKSRCNIVQ